MIQKDSHNVRMSEKQPAPYPLRMPEGMRESLTEAAQSYGRSLNAEIVARLEESFQEPAPKPAQLAPEHRKKELLLDYEEWLLDPTNPREEKGSFREYCRLYNGDDPDGEQVDSVSDIDEIEPDYLREMALAWRLYARESRYVKKYDDPTKPQRLAHERRKGELLVGYLECCEYWGFDPASQDAVEKFCQAYNSKGTPQTNGKIVDIPEISPGYLEELFKVWGNEVPYRLEAMRGANRAMFEQVTELYKQQSHKLDAIEQFMAELQKKLQK